MSFMKRFIECTECLVECLYLELRISAVGKFDGRVMVDLHYVG
ncbi:MAG: hypothetical protein ABL924_09405 [Methyloglobulus sp.]